MRSTGRIGQRTFATDDFDRSRKPTRREEFLAEMVKVVRWAELVAVTEPDSPKASSAGDWPTAGLERMLRIQCRQPCFDLSDLTGIPRFLDASTSDPVRMRPCSNFCPVSGIGLALPFGASWHLRRWSIVRAAKPGVWRCTSRRYNEEHGDLKPTCRRRRDQ